MRWSNLARSALLSARHLLRRYAGGRSHRGDICPCREPSFHARPMAWSHRFEVCRGGGRRARRGGGGMRGGGMRGGGAYRGGGARVAGRRVSWSRRLSRRRALSQGGAYQKVGPMATA